MELVVDANILFSALIKSGITRELMVNDELLLYTPEYLINEFFEHIEELQKKTHADTFKLQNEGQKLIYLSHLKIIPIREINPYVKTAKTISSDPEDILYFATALKMNCALWSNDKELKNQNQVKIYSTSDLVKILK